MQDSDVEIVENSDLDIVQVSDSEVSVDRLLQSVFQPAASSTQNRDAGLESLEWSQFPLGTTTRVFLESHKTRKNAIVEYLDYQIPVTQLNGDMQAAKRD